jgi:hypothetical protein
VTKATPVNSILASINPTRPTPKKKNNRPFRLDKMAEPLILSKGFIIGLLFVVNLILCFIRYRKTIISYFIKKGCIEPNTTRKNFFIRQRQFFI